MDLDRLQQRSRLAVRASICLFAASVPLSVAGANISWGILLAGLLLFRGTGGRLSLDARRSALEAPLWIYLGVAILCGALGTDARNSFGHLNQDAHKVWLYLLFSVALAVEPCPSAWMCMAAGFAAAGIIGIEETLRHALEYRRLHLAEYWRTCAFVHPVTFGEQTCVALLGAVCLLLKPGNLLSRPGAKAWAASFAALMATTLLMSQTRGAMLALVPGLAAVVCLIPRVRWVLVPGAGSVVGAFLLIENLRYHKPLWVRLFEPLQDPYFQGPLLIGGSMMRLVLWKIAWMMGKDHPWTGVGPNNFPLVLPRYIQALFEDMNSTWGSAHNLFLHHFAERGVIGLGATLLLVAALCGRAWQRARESPDFWNLWALSTSVAFVAMNMTEVAMETEILWMLVFFIWIWAEKQHLSEAGLRAS